jgi:hypothetical protein
MMTQMIQGEPTRRQFRMSIRYRIGEFGPSMRQRIGFSDELALHHQLFT